MDVSQHLLVVDDHRDIRELLARFLVQHGFRVSTAESAAAARKVLKGNAVDLVVLDIMMPGEDGLSLCRELRATTGTPIMRVAVELHEDGTYRPHRYTRPRDFPLFLEALDIYREQIARGVRRLVA